MQRRRWWIIFTDMTSPFTPLIGELTAALTDRAEQNRLLAPLLLALCNQLRRVLAALEKLFAGFQAATLAHAPPPAARPRHASPARARRPCATRPRAPRRPHLGRVANLRARRSGLGRRMRIAAPVPPRPALRACHAVNLHRR